MQERDSGESQELIPSEMEEHAGRRHKGPEAAAQIGRGESKGKAFSSLSLRVSNCQMEAKRKNKSQSTEVVYTSQLSGSQSMLRTDTGGSKRFPHAGEILVINSKTDTN